MMKFMSTIFIISGLVRSGYAFLGPTLSSGRSRSIFRLGANREKYNPISTMLGDMASSIFGSNKGPSAVNPNIDATLLELGTPWEKVKSSLEILQTVQEKQFRSNLVKGYGAPSPLHKIRLFDESNKEEDVRITFYRDSASWCPYCQKVWMCLEEKKIPYKIEKVNMRCYGDKPASFTAIQPNGNIPVAVIDDRVYGQSNDIIYALDKLFPDHKSLKPKESDAMEAQSLLRLERQIFSAWMYWLTGDSDPSGRYRAAFIASLKEVEAALASRGPFFMGSEVTLVDFMFMPFLERMCASLLFYKGFTMRVPSGAKTDYPALNKWFDAMETLESYQLTKSDYYTHCWDLPPQLGGCSYEKAGEPFENAINGLRSLDGTQGSWELPLMPHNGGVEPDWAWAGDETAARREAVERVSFNHEAIVNFAARGAGKKGFRSYGAPLADPMATPNETVQGGVSAALSLVCMSMLEGHHQHDAAMDQMVAAIVRDGGEDYTRGVTASLVYLRDRVGVPRDMRLPAARQLRAHLNWAIGKMLANQN
jgi:glutathione S-transferase